MSGNYRTMSTLRAASLLWISGELMESRKILEVLSDAEFFANFSHIFHILV